MGICEGMGRWHWLPENRVVKKAALALVLVLALILPHFTPACAYVEKNHNEFMEKVLFGDSRPHNEEAIKMLESSSYLAIDLYNDHIHGKGTTALNYLVSKSIHGLSADIKKIDFPSNQYHRKHTHKGWDFIDYTGYPKDEDIAHWKRRKDILLAVVNNVFNLRFLSGSWLGRDLGYDDRSNSISALIYYIHILGDHIYDKEIGISSGGDIIMPLARNHPGNDNPDIIWELQKHLKTLFDSPSNENVYKSMKSDMDVIREEASAFSDVTAGISSNAYAGELMDILETHVPILLRKEYFFLKVFYPDRVTRQ